MDRWHIRWLTPGSCGARATLRRAVERGASTLAHHLPIDRSANNRLIARRDDLPIATVPPVAVRVGVREGVTTYRGQQRLVVVRVSVVGVRVRLLMFTGVDVPRHLATPIHDVDVHGDGVVAIELRRGLTELASTARLQGSVRNLSIMCIHTKVSRNECRMVRPINTGASGCRITRGIRSMR